MRLTNLYLIFLSVAVTGFYVVAAVYFPKLYVFCTYEDMYGEWGQFFFFFATFVFSLLNALDSRNGRYRWFFTLLAIASFYTFMEEISWGQRLFNLATPEFFSEHSYQDEINLHNLLTGPVESWTKTALTYLISIAFVGYGILFPLTLKAQWKPAVLFDQWGVVAPPLALIPAFLAAAVCEMEFFSFNEAEVAELLVAMAMALTAFNVWLVNRAIQPSKAVFGYILLTFAVLGTANATTTLLLNQPEQQAQIKSRLANGYKKFAKRYKRYDHYAAIIEVLQLYDELRPDNTVILRKIASNYEKLNQYDKANEFINKAIEVGLRRITKKPENVPTLISLAKSYHAIQRPEKVNFYAQTAYQIAVQKLKQADDDKQLAYWYYWLAKSCEQINRQPDALKYFRKAYKTMPDNYRYRRAYYNKRRLMEKYYDEDWTTRIYTN